MMNHLKLWMGIACLWLGILACNPLAKDPPWIYAQTPVPAPDQRGGKPLVVATGDSIAAGWGDCRERRCLGVEYDWWQAALGDQAIVLTRGIGSSTTQDLLDRWVQDTQGADVLIILTGVNDVARDVTAENILKNFATMQQRATQAGQTIIFSTIMPSDSTDTPAKLAVVEAVNAALRASDWWVIDLYGEMVDPEQRGTLRRDEIAHQGSAHPNLRGYDRMAEFVRAWWMAHQVDFPSPTPP